MTREPLCLPVSSLQKRSYSWNWTKLKMKIFLLALLLLRKLNQVNPPRPKGRGIWGVKKDKPKMKVS
jgi:hypothetical protein